MLRFFRQRTRSGFLDRDQAIGRARRCGTMLMRRLAVAPIALALLAACRGGFRLDRLGTDPQVLYAAGMDQLTKHRWENAILVFEKLATDLPARDTLLPHVQFNLGTARSGNLEHLLAAQAFTKVAENYPEDSLADDAMYESGREYQKLWRSPELDSQYGTTAQATFRTMVAVYPDSPKRKEAETQLHVLEEMFATKEYLAGFYYLRRKAYDPAILYFKTVVNTYPESMKTKDAYLRMVESYRIIRYKEEAVEACAILRKRFPTDAEVQKTCPPEPVKADSTGQVPKAPVVPPAPAPVRKP